MGGPLLVVAAAVDRLELVQGTQPGRTNWVDLVPLFIIPVVVGGALLYGGVIPTAQGHGQVFSRSRLVEVPVFAFVLIGWTCCA